MLVWRATSASDGRGAGPLLTVSSRALANLPGGKTGFDMAALERMPQRRIVTTTPWFTHAREFTGPLLRDVLEHAGLRPATGAQARCTALNDYRVDIPVADIRRFDVIVARLLDGKAMTVREKGPLFVMYPFDAEPQLRTSPNLGRCIWQLCGIEIL